MWDNFLLPGDLLLARYQESSIWLASSRCATPRWVIIIGYYRIILTKTNQDVGKYRWIRKFSINQLASEDRISGFEHCQAQQ